MISVTKHTEYPRRKIEKMKQSARVSLLKPLCLLIITIHGLHAEDTRSGKFALVGGSVVTMAGRTYEAGTILVDEGKIIDVGGSEVDVPFKYAKIDVKGFSILPGLIDSNTHLGLIEIDMEPDSREISKIDDPIMPQIRAADGINPASSLIPVARINGITTAMVNPGENGLFSGQGAIIDLAGDLVSDMLVETSAVILLNLGDSGGGGSLSSRMGRMAIIRETFQRAKEYKAHKDRFSEELSRFEKKRKMAAENTRTSEKNAASADKAGSKDESSERKEGETKKSDSTAAGNGAGASSKEDSSKKEDSGKDLADKEEPLPPMPPSLDLKLESLVRALDGKVPVFVRAHRLDDILRAIELKREYKLNVVINHGTDAYKVAAQLAKEGIAVVVGPINTQPDSFETLGASYANAAKLSEAGVLFSIQTEDDHNVRNLPFMAGLACANGLDRDEALRSITINAAKILGIDDRYGSIEKGKVANLIVVKGDVLQPRSSIERVFIRGKEIALGSRQLELYEKFRPRN